MSNSDNTDSVRKRALVPKEDCPMALAAELVGDRWTLLILREAFYGVVRYDDMLSDLSAPRSMLTDRLSKMVDHGLLERQPYREAGSRVRNAYVLTEAGRALGTTLIALKAWGETHLLGKKTPVKVVDATSGETVQLQLVTQTGRVVPLRNAGLQLKPNSK